MDVGMVQGRKILGTGGGGYFGHKLGNELKKMGTVEQLQNTPQLIYMSLNKNSVYCVMPRSSKPPDTCK